MIIFRIIYRFLVDAIQGIVIGGAVAVFIFAFLFQPHEVSGLSMYPTFNDKEYLITSLIEKHLDRIDRGDVIVFKPPIEVEKNFIKRIVAVGGDKIRIENGNVYLNDRLLDENMYLSSYIKTNAGTFLKEGISLTVPSDDYFVMGDNRLYSSDSREWGFLPKSNIIGKSVLRIWPLAHFSVIQNPYRE